MPQVIFHLSGATTPPPVARVFREERRCYNDREFQAGGADDYGFVYELTSPTNHFSITVGAGPEAGVYRYYPALGKDVWARPGRTELYHVRPSVPRGTSRAYFERLRRLLPAAAYVPETDVLSGPRPSMLGALPLTDGGVSFGLFQPYAAQVFLVGDFNDWQCPGHPWPQPAKFLPMDLYLGYQDQPNLWLLHCLDIGGRGQLEYGFFVRGGVAVGQDLRPDRYQVDPFARAYGRDFVRNNARLVDPGFYRWGDAAWRLPACNDLVLYEMSVYGLTQGDPDVPPAEHGTFAGVIRRIERGYFNDLGVNTLALMPTSEAPSFQGPSALGYDPCGFVAIERDFGTPDEFRRLVDTAHQHGLAVLVDAVFNHTANSFNPLWGAIGDGTPGGFYFSGGTPWGNRVATERPEVQNVLIDACKLMLKEYHVDGFRFDATHSDWMDHGFLRRLAHEIKDRGFKPDCVLIAENLPNEADLNLEGYNGFAQWCDPFHDKIKALLREGVYQDWVTDDPAHLGEVFYFCKDFYAAHTNNVVNFCESHDENSVPFEAATNPAAAGSPADRRRKARLGIFAAMTALGQPMLYMGQEFGVDRPRNLVIFDRPDNPDEDPFFAWTRKLIHLRNRHPALRVSGYNPAGEGKFAWVAGPWFDEAHGGGRKVIAWRTKNGDAGESMAVAINFSKEPVRLALGLGEDGAWRQVADLDAVDEEVGPVFQAENGTIPSFELPPMNGAVLIKQ